MMNFYYRLKPGRKKTRRDDDKCLVCGGLSIGLNFGVQTCSPCKAFFRRNAVKLGSYEFRCPGDGDCPVTSYTRRQCNCCRLAKCFRVGMDRTAIRTDDQRLERNRLIEYNRQQRAEKQIMIRPSNLSNYKSLTLSFNDQTLLTNIMSAYDQTCVSLRYQHLKTPNDNTLSLEKFMNSIAHMYMALIKYFKFIPEFSNLSVSLKKSLVKNNLNQIFRLNNALVVKATGIADEPSSFIIMHLFPPDLFFELCKCTIGIFPYLSDPILLKLILIVLMFSTHLNIRYENNYLIDNDDDYFTLKIFNIQNIYAELLWRYILYRCSNFQDAVKLFNTFIARLVYSQFINIKLNEFVSKLSPNQTDQLEPIMKTMWTDDEK